MINIFYSHGKEFCRNLGAILFSYGDYIKLFSGEIYSVKKVQMEGKYKQLIEIGSRDKFFENIDLLAVKNHG